MNSVEYNTLVNNVGGVNHKAHNETARKGHKVFLPTNDSFIDNNNK